MKHNFRTSGGSNLTGFKRTYKELKQVKVGGINVELRLCFKRTYKELKLSNSSASIPFSLSFKRTYKELKHWSVVGKYRDCQPRFKRTYKELKLK